MEPNDTTLDVTDRFLDFREAVRHLWNVHFRHDASLNQDWDLRDAFSDAYVALFRAMVMHHLPEGAHPIAHLWDANQTVLNCYEVTGLNGTGLSPFSR